MNAPKPMPEANDAFRTCDCGRPTANRRACNHCCNREDTITPPRYRSRSFVRRSLRSCVPAKVS